MSAFECKLKVIKLLISLIVINRKITELQACSADFDCPYKNSKVQYCCKRYGFPAANTCDYNCTGRLCVYHTNCAPGELCQHGVCAKADGECNSNADCALFTKLKRYCCEKTGSDDNICSSNCVGESCHANSDCAENERCRGEICEGKDGECDSDLDCTSLSKGYCCERTGSDDNICATASDCLGISCRDDNDCAKKEYCLNSKCEKIKGECRSNRDCSSSSPYCCRRTISTKNSVCSLNCLGESCGFNKDCAPEEHCYNQVCIKKTQPKDGVCDGHWDCLARYGSTDNYCCKTRVTNNKCARNCIFYFCDNDSDCAAEECCHNHSCASSCDSERLADWVIAIAIALGIIIIIAIPVVIVWICYRKEDAVSQRRAQGEIPLTQIPATATMAPQNNQDENLAQTYRVQPYPHQGYPPPQYRDLSAPYEPNKPLLVHNPPEQHPPPEYQSQDECPPYNA